MPDITKGTTFSDGQEVTASDLNSLLDSASINSLAITEAKLADGAVSSAKLGSGAIDYSKLESLADGKIVVGNAGTATAATLAGAATISYDSSTGNATITLDPESITEQTAKGSTAHDNDVLLVIDSQDSNVLKKLVVSNLPTGSSGDTIPTGCMFPFAGAILPSGWFWCRGEEKSQTEFSALYSAIGDSYGTATGSGNFVLPDLGGRVPAGREPSASRLTTAGSGINGASVGAGGGSQTHTLTSPDELPSHGHSHSLDVDVTFSLKDGLNESDNWFLHGATSSSYDKIVTYGHSNTFKMKKVVPADYFDVDSSFSGSISSTGSSGAHNNTQPTLIVNYIIKY